MNRRGTNKKRSQEVNVVVSDIGVIDGLKVEEACDRVRVAFEVGDCCGVKRIWHVAFVADGLKNPALHQAR